MTCPECNGDGYWISYPNGCEYDCFLCNGSGHIPEDVWAEWGEKEYSELGESDDLS